VGEGTIRVSHYRDKSAWGIHKHFDLAGNENIFEDIVTWLSKKMPIILKPWSIMTPQT